MAALLFVPDYLPHTCSQTFPGNSLPKTWTGFSRCKTRRTLIVIAASVSPGPGSTPPPLLPERALERIAHRVQLLREDELIGTVAARAEIRAFCSLRRASVG